MKNKGTLTLKKLKRLYKKAKQYKDKPEFHIIFKNKFPFISFEWFVKI